MPRIAMAALAGGLFLFTSGCSAVAKNSPLQANAEFNPEYHRLWTRPAEMGYELKARVESEVSVSKFLGLTVGGEKPTDVSFVGVVSGLAKGDLERLEDPLVRNAATKAIDDSKADGIYVLRTELRETGLWPLFEVRTAKVKGISLVVKDLGQVSQERADKDRFLRISPSPLIATTPEASPALTPTK